MLALQFVWELLYEIIKDARIKPNNNSNTAVREHKEPKWDKQ